MGDVIAGAAQEFWDMLVGAFHAPGLWTYALIIVVAVALVAVLFRGKRMTWALLPVLAGLAYWGWSRFRRY